jgi:hypothetical protein
MPSAHILTYLVVCTALLVDPVVSRLLGDEPQYVAPLGGEGIAASNNPRVLALAPTNNSSDRLPAFAGVLPPTAGSLNLVERQATCDVGYGYCSGMLTQVVLQYLVTDFTSSFRTLLSCGRQVLFCRQRLLPSTRI